MSENILPSCISLPLSGKELEEIVSKAKDYALMHGICMRSKANFNPDNLQFAPFVLTPSLYPRKEFEKATKLQIILNKMIHNVAHDVDFLRETLASTIKVDDFTASLFKIYETVLSEGVAQEISLGLVRSDTMLETRKSCFSKSTCMPSRSFYCCVAMVEINTIASGFGWLGPASGLLQSYILQELGHDDKVKYLPENNALAGLCDAMVEAWKIIGDDKAAILFIIEDVTYNICDQRFHEFYIREKYPHVKVIRQSLTEIFKEGKLGDNKTLIVGNVTASVVYFRAGYEPGHYHSENEWAARLMIERSTAIKCPSVHYHLAGTKKVQQALAKPGVLNRFLNDENEIKQVKEIFTGLYSFDKGEGGDETVKMVLEKPENFVMKPQREGGGNNIYGVDIPERLKAMDETERSAYILMERIFPPISKSYMIRPGGPNPPPIFDMVSELGIFGAIIGTKEKILYNRQVGHMLRTKVSSANEGGVAAGLGALDSVYLTNEF
ncbi:CLUMA_CG015836, isoform B [Clunio marinus]|uniref:Glutathione synthetase n=1 Tax=Clunio marinus TaxID=568069 RepID=A0A1J1IR10_9DIPT|nr:CLUMA_CG015836, isoform B [Clunio marinus]